MCIHICIYTERGKKMKLPNDLDELLALANDKKLNDKPKVEAESEPEVKPEGMLLDGQTVSEAKEEVANPDSAFENERIFSRKRNKLVHVRMTEQEKITAEMMANYHNLPLSAYIRALIKQDMRRNRQVNKVKEAGGNVD